MSHGARGAPQQQQHLASLPSALSPSSWARASVPLGYPYGADFGASSRYLAAAPLVGAGLGLYQQGRYSEPLSLRGKTVLLRAVLLLNVFLWLIRDASLQSFLLYALFINVVAYFLIVRGEPFSLALVVESAANVAAKQNAAAAQAAQAAHVQQPIQQQQQQQQVSYGVQRPLSASSSPLSPASSSGASSAKPSPTPVAFAFNSPVVQASAAQQHSVTMNASPTPTQPNFHEQDSTKAAGQAAGSHLGDELAAASSSSSSLSVPRLNASSSSSGLPTIEPSNMPQTPSVEPVITPMPQRPSGGASSLAPVAHVASALRLPTESTPVVIAGATSRYSNSDDIMCWSRAEGSSYDVRVGPNYKKYGKKEPSRAAMFECVGCDVFGAPDGKLEHVAAHLQLPWIAKPRGGNDDPRSSVAEGDIEAISAATSASLTPPPEEPSPPDVMDPVTKAWDHYEVDPRVLAQDEELGIPSLFIINFQIPTYAPGYFSTKEDGEGFSILLYFQITRQTRAEMRSGRLPGALQLFKDFVANAHEFEYHSRFKCIPRIVNPGDAKVGMAARSAMKMYNSKPFLTGPHCHAFIRGPGYMEADIDVHRFCLTARKGAHGFLDALSSLVVDVGFVVEGGREGADEELPEQILGCGHIAHLDPLNAKSLAYYIEVGKRQRAERMAKQGH